MSKRDPYEEALLNGEASLETEVTQMATLIRSTRERLVEEITEGTGSATVLTKSLSTLSGILKQAVDMQLKLQANARHRAERMTQTEYLQAAMRLVLSCDNVTKNAWLRELQAKMGVAEAKAEMLKNDQ